MNEEKLNQLSNEIAVERDYLDRMDSWAFCIFLTIIGLVITLTLLAVTSAAIIPVNQSIQDAINNATENDTIFIQSGNYTEQLMINKSITIIGEANTILFTPENLNYTPTSAYYSRPLIVIYSSDPLNNTINVTILNLTLDGNYSSQDYLKAVQFFSADGSLINLNVKNFRDENITASSRKKSSVTINHPYDYFLPQNVLIENCSFENYQQSGILASEIGTNVTIRGNSFIGGGNMSYMKQYGIQVNYGATGTIENNKIRNHYFIPSYNATGGVGEAAAILTFGNNVYVNDTNFTLNISEVLIKNNLIFNNSFGIYVDGEENYSAGNVVVTENKFLNNLAAIFLNNASINATLNYWGVVLPNFTALILGDGNFSVENEPYYTNFAKTTKNTDPVPTPPSSDSSSGGSSGGGGGGGSDFVPVKKNVTKTNLTITPITTPIQTETPVETPKNETINVPVTDKKFPTWAVMLIILGIGIAIVGFCYWFFKPEPSILPAAQISIRLGEI